MILNYTISLVSYSPYLLKSISHSLHQIFLLPPQKKSFSNFIPNQKKKKKHINSDPKDSYAAITNSIYSPPSLRWNSVLQNKQATGSAQMRSRQEATLEISPWETGRSRWVDVLGLVESWWGSGHTHHVPY